MAVKVRMTRMGGKNDPFFRIVATDCRTARDGRYLENLGWYDPKKAENNCNLKMDRIEYWVSNGAELSDTVRNLVNKAKKVDVVEETPA